MEIFILIAVAYIFMILMITGGIFIIIGFIYKADIIVNLIAGFMIGFLINEDVYIENDKQIAEYTLQCLIGVISITVIWERQIG